MERGGSWRHGALTSLLDSPASGPATTLLAMADREQAADLERRGPGAVAPLKRRCVGSALVGAACSGAGLLAFVSAGPARGTAAALWHPARAWAATVAPVRIRASKTVVERGDSVDFEVQAIGHRAATLWLRAPGEGWHAKRRSTRLDWPSHGHERSASERSVRAGHQRHPRVRYGHGACPAARLPGARNRDGALSVVSRPRCGAGADRRRHPSLAGGHSTRDPRRSDRTDRACGVVIGHSDRRAHGTRGALQRQLRSRRVRRLSAGLATASGAPLAGDTVRLAVRLVADSAPRVDVPVPGVDTMAPLSLLVPLVVDVRDDHGITGVILESRRISRLGGARFGATRDARRCRRDARPRHPHADARPQSSRPAARRHRALCRDRRR